MHSSGVFTKALILAVFSIVTSCSAKSTPSTVSYFDDPNGCSVKSYREVLKSNFDRFSPGLNRADVDEGIQALARSFYDQLGAKGSGTCSFKAEAWYPIGDLITSYPDFPIVFQVDVKVDGICISVFDELNQVTSEFPSHWKEVENHPVIRRQIVYDALCFGMDGNFLGYRSNE